MESKIERILYSNRFINNESVAAHRIDEQEQNFNRYIHYRVNITYSVLCFEI